MKLNLVGTVPIWMMVFTSGCLILPLVTDRIDFVNAIVKNTPAAGALWTTRPMPVAGVGELLVRIDAVSLCGTDLHVYNWDAWSAGRVKPPVTMGHEWAGEVLELGPNTTGFVPGDRVSGESHKICGHCRQCRTGDGHVCTSTQIFGVDTDGCFGQYFAVPAASVLKNDPRIPNTISCLQDPLGNAVHAALVEPLAGKSVAILGCGPIGLFAIAVCRAVGATNIIATDASPYRMDLAKTVGADHVLNVRDTDVDDAVATLTHGIGVDVVLEMSGAPKAIQQSLRLAKPGGRISLMGIPAGSVDLNVAEDIIFKGLRIHGVVGRRLYDTWFTMQDLLASGRLDVTPIRTHILPFDQFDAGFALMQAGTCGKVVLKVSEHAD